MSATETIPYFSAQTDTCPLCRKRPVRKKTIYGHPVCKKCFYAFANRRQLAYLIDTVLMIIPGVIVGLAVTRYLQQMGLHYLGLQIGSAIAGIPLFCLFLMKDGFTGQSPGKKLTGVRALDEPTGQPIGFMQSFKRNSVLLGGVLPFLGGLVNLVIIIIIATQVARGYRLGDRFARTRVIWLKYAHLPVFGGNALVCEKCGYDLQANTSGICPECGTAVSERNASRLAAANQPALVSGT